jgi:hypothetical protein
MKDEYDFSKPERGGFCRPDAVLAPPVHLDPEGLAFLSALAKARGVTLSELVNALLKKDIELIKRPNRFGPMRPLAYTDGMRETIRAMPAVLGARTTVLYRAANRRAALCNRVQIGST